MGVTRGVEVRPEHVVVLQQSQRPQRNILFKYELTEIKTVELKSHALQEVSHAKHMRQYEHKTMKKENTTLSSSP